MTYIFPECLYPLRDYLDDQGADTSSMKTAKQAAFIAQQLLGSFVRFPKGRSDMTPTLLRIQKSIKPGKNSGVSGSSKPSARTKSLPPAAVMKNRKRAERDRRSACEGRRIARNYTGEAERSGIHIFCDGAAVPNPGDGGWGVVVYSDGAEINAVSGGVSNATNNQMELKALLEAITVATELSKSTGQRITVWSDSDYCVKGANTWLAGWKRNGWARGKNAVLLNSEMWRSIDAALGMDWQLRISINWVKGHCGIPGNVRADNLAAEGKRSLFPAMRPTRLHLNPRPVPQDNQERVFDGVGMDERREAGKRLSVNAGADVTTSHHPTASDQNGGTGHGQTRSILSVVRQPMENQTKTTGNRKATPSAIRDLFDAWKTHVDNAALIAERISGFRARTAEEFALKLLLKTAHDRSAFNVSEEQLEEARAIDGTDTLPAYPESGDLEAVITEYVMAEAAWNACRPDGDFCFEGPLVDVYDEKRDRFILFPCTTEAEVQRKLAYVAGDRATAEILEYDDWNARFRASLLLPAAAQTARGADPASKRADATNEKTRKPVVVEHKVKRRAAR